MKKILLVLLAVGILMVISFVGKASSEVVLISTVTNSFNTSVSTTSSVGLLAPNTLPKARIKHMTISWDVQSSTSTLTLWDNLRGASSTKIYELKIPSGTVFNIHKETYEYALPKIADYGLIAVLDNSDHVVSVIVEYW